MNIWVILAVAAYLVGMICIGYLSYTRTGKGLQDYFLANRTFGPFVIGMGLIATLLSSWGFMGNAGLAYQNGFGQWVLALYDMVSIVTIWVFGVRVWLLSKKYGYITPVQLIVARYDNNRVLHWILSVSLIVLLIPRMSIQVTSMGRLIESISGGAIPFFWGATVLGLIMMLYVLLGGMRGVAITDVVQGLVMSVGMIVVLWVFLVVRGQGISNVFQKLEQMEPALFSLPGPVGYFIPQVIFSQFLVFFVGNFPIPGMWMRCMAAKDVKSLKQGCIISGIAYPLVLGSTMLAGLAGRVFFPDIAHPDSIIPTMVSFLHPIWTALLSGGIIAAAMSTVDSELLAVSAIATKDISQSLLRMVNVNLLARVVVVVMMVVIWYFGITSTGLIGVIALLTSAACAQTIPLLIGATMWRRATTQGALAGYTVGIIALIITQYFIKNPLGFQPVFWGLLANTATFVVVSLLTKAPDAEVVEKFHGYLDRALQKTDKTTIAPPGKVLEAK
jgi:SSS family solute:Na+ symporter